MNLLRMAKVGFAAPLRFRLPVVGISAQRVHTGIPDIGFTSVTRRMLQFGNDEADAFLANRTTGRDVENQEDEVNLPH